MSENTNIVNNATRSLLEHEKALAAFEASGSLFPKGKHAEERHARARENIGRDSFRNARHVLADLQITGDMIEKYDIGLDYAALDRDHGTEEIETAAIIPVDGKNGSNNFEVNLIGFETAYTDPDNPVYTFLTKTLQTDSRRIYIVPDIISAIVLTERGFPAMAAGIAIPDLNSQIQEDRRKYTEYVKNTAAEIAIHNLSDKEIVIVKGINDRNEKRAPDVRIWNAQFHADLIRELEAYAGINVRKCQLDYFTAAKAARNGMHMLRKYLNQTDDSRKDILQQNDLYYLNFGFWERIEEIRELDFGTGFQYFDETFGKMSPGLYCLGGLTGCGKTTFALQVADQVAASGHPVIYFSLEQSREELTMKSISRICSQKYGVYISSMDLLTGYNPNPDKCSAVIREHNKNNAIENAFKYYQDIIAPNKWTLQREFKADYTEIRKRIEAFIKRTDKLPLVIVDYLQVLSLPEGSRKTDTEAVNEIVENLKQASKDYSVPIWVLSALNRASYNTPISNADFKQSGQIEYTADYLLGIQYKDIQTGTIMKAKEGKSKKPSESEIKAAADELSMQYPRKMTIAILKSRGRSKSHKFVTRDGKERETNLFRFDYRPNVDCFEEIRPPNWRR